MKLSVWSRSVKAFSVNDWSKWLFSKPYFYSLYPLYMCIFSLLFFSAHVLASLWSSVARASKHSRKSLSLPRACSQGDWWDILLFVGFICVCSHSCIYVGFCMRVCYMRRNVKTNANIFHLCVSNQFSLTRILLRQKRIGWRQGREEKRKGRKRQEEDRAVWRKKKRGAYKERD